MGTTFSKPEKMGGFPEKSAEVITTPAGGFTMHRVDPPDPRDVKVAALEKRVESLEKRAAEAAEAMHELLKRKASDPAPAMVMQPPQPQQQKRR